MLLPAEVSILRGNPAAASQMIEAASRRAAEFEMAKVYRLEFLRADALARIVRVEEARQAYRREIELFPSGARAYPISRSCNSSPVTRVAATGPWPR
jgi:predicted RNA polymerase sigma factor